MSPTVSIRSVTRRLLVVVALAALAAMPMTTTAHAEDGNASTYECGGQNYGAQWSSRSWSSCDDDCGASTQGAQWSKSSSQSNGGHQGYGAQWSSDDGSSPQKGEWSSDGSGCGDDTAQRGAQWSSNRQSRR